ncbi:MotE family protein [Aristophania vespae]|uniref:MotE family protein n=1 Tax=Aristophania vespae TaxID=2697033 RepID=UPI002351BEEA|nr:hypothetical protein [Aristophania vespae]
MPAISTSYKNIGAVIAATIFYLSIPGFSWGNEKETASEVTPIMQKSASHDDDIKSVEDIEEQKRILETAKQALAEKLQTVRATTGDVEDYVSNNQLVDKEAVKKLISIYENMRPREAAAVFDVMDPHVLVAISARMNTRKLSAIMAQMSRERVNMVSQYLIGVRTFHQKNTLNIFNLDDKLSDKLLSTSNDNHYSVKSKTVTGIRPLLPSRQ